MVVKEFVGATAPIFKSIVVFKLKKNLYYLRNKVLKTAGLAVDPTSIPHCSKGIQLG